MAIKPIDVTLRGSDQTKPAFDSAHKNAEGFSAQLTETLNKPFELLKGLLAVELVNIVGEFFKGTVEAAAESEAAWVRVGQAVDNAGVSFQGVRGELGETFKELSDKTRFSEKEVSDAFATVLNVSNDYAGSLKNLPLITDIAIAKQLDLSTAATIVGKAMDGQTTLLKRYGIIIKDGADAMDELNKRFSGFAERDGASLQGRLHSIANEWEELKVKVGEAITSSDGASKSAGSLSNALTDLSKWITANTENIRGFVSGLHDVGAALLDIANQTVGSKGVLGFLGTAFGGIKDMVEDDAVRVGQYLYGDGEDAAGEKSDNAAVLRAQQKKHAIAEEQIPSNSRQAAADKQKRDDDAADKALTKRIADLKTEADILVKARDMVGLSDADYAKLAGIQQKLQQMEKDTNIPLRERVAIHEQLQKITDAEHKRNEEMLKDALKIVDLEKKGIGLSSIAGPGKVALVKPANPITVRASASDLTGTGAGSPGADPLSFGNEFKHGAQQASDALSNVETSIDSVGRMLGTISGGALKDFFGEWQQGIAAVIQGHEAMGVVIPRVLRRAVGASLAADAQDTFLRAAKAFALGLTDPTGISLGQAARLFAIGTAEVAAAAALSGGGSSGGGSYGGGVSAAGFQSQQGSTSNAGKVTVVFPGRRAIIDTTNPDDLNALRDALQSLVGTRDLEFLFQND